jgi:Protein of unknown function (DUF2927)
MDTGAATRTVQAERRLRLRIHRQRACRWWLALAGLAAVSACDLAKLQPLAGRSAAPEPQRAGAPPTPGPEAAGVSGGKSLTDFYAGVENDLVASGRMRRETAPADAPFTVDDLVRDFVRVALYDEYVDLGGRFVRSETPALLRRWDRPVRVGVMTGPSVPPEAAARDRANVAAFTQRLADLTGHDMAIGADEEVNFLVLFMNSAERTAFAEQVAARYPGFAPAVMSALHDTPLDTFCTAYAFSDPTQPSVYSAVIILIRAEHPPLTKLSCVNEEMAQAMGLPNDSPESRPSLFNDNLEFALLTEHDAILLRMLYDSRLRPGMTAAEVRPLLPAIAQDAMAAQERDQRVASVAGNF